MALALELSRREGQPGHTPQKPNIQHRPPASTHTTSTHRSYSSAPFYNYGVETDSDDDEDDEDLQMALACSLSEMEAEQRAAVADIITGAVREGKAMAKKGGGKQTRVIVNTTTTTVNADGSKYTVSGEVDEKGEFKMDSGTESGWETGDKGSGQSDTSPESPTTTTSSTAQSPGSEQESEQEIKTSKEGVKKKNKCGCTVC